MSRGTLLVTAMALFGCAKAAQRPDPMEDVDAPVDPPMIDAPDIDAPVAMPDANMCATQPCDILTKCGCAAGNACDIDFSDLMGTACRPINIAGHETDTCVSTNNNCDAGFVCLGSAAGRSCKKYCSTNADCGAPRGQCVIDITNGSTPIAGAPSVCSSNCDPTNVAAGSCPAGYKCNLFQATHNGSTVNIVDCDPSVGAGTQGANCTAGTAGNDALCAANHSCTTLNGTTFNCRKICNKAASNCGAMTCIGFNPALTVGGIEYGVCN